ncbi:MAG TPA: hypothetical protein VMK13_18100 [Streptosporangiaceae bacterium]|nr:hypothetical protein [Streptosporangiaceae bacterium]
MSTQVLTDAAVDALAGLFPGWRVWADVNGWHARRRGIYLQSYHLGAPSFCVHAGCAVGLAAQLRWQQAADAHAPFGCSYG